MSEDERFLASEEGKRLSSKERQRLRNKVSARAFRSRKKEYISQLESGVALTTQDVINLRRENVALLSENERYRDLIRSLLRQPTFTLSLNNYNADCHSLSAAQLEQKVMHHSSTHEYSVQPKQDRQEQQAWPPQQQW
ncbi:hypothetical protein WHR41_09185 [Cladosporium halotolerans]|uniref:BZIP domain-containing protein n=1 Tax=Cladosporium halotolerans TaxID=1052096 RepID=A0AB34KCB3_9PEZI